MDQTSKMEKLQQTADQAINLMKVLANKDRMILLCQISSGEKCVSELEEVTGIKQPTLSQQLTVLRNEAVVATRKDGKKVYYSLASEIAASLMDLLHEHYCSKL
jgi:DNA-binding transcriptional ArsR family regulator